MEFRRPRRASEWQTTLEIHKRIAATPSVWIGEVSWLKAVVSLDADTYVPDPVRVIDELIGEKLPTLTAELRDQIVAALGIPNRTDYRISDAVPVRDFLNLYMGNRLFTVSW